jgi:alkylation response protein AidB-like acyl-CoA dehydrogenase
MSSGSRHATWIGLHASVYDRAGAAVPLPPGVSARVFFVPAEAVTWVDNWDVIGLNATNSGGFKVDDVFVPDGYSVLREHHFDPKIDTTLARFPLNSFFSTGFSGVALGIARSMLDAAVALAREKTPRAARHSLKDNHLVQFQVGEAEARLRSARGYVEAAAVQVWNDVVASGELTFAQRVDLRMATTFAIGEAKTVADTAWEIAGASAIFASSPFERRYRDIRTVTQQVQGRKSHLQEVGGYLLGIDAPLTFG